MAKNKENAGDALRVTLLPSDGAWRRGNAVAGTEAFAFCFQQAAAPGGSAGLDGGRLTRLYVQTARNETLVLYNRGWSMGMKPWRLSPAAQMLYNYILATFN